MTDTKSLIQEAWRTPDKETLKYLHLGISIFKLQKIKDKEKNLERYQRVQGTPLL